MDTFPYKAVHQKSGLILFECLCIEGVKHDVQTLHVDRQQFGINIKTNADMTKRQRKHRKQTADKAGKR